MVDVSLQHCILSPLFQKFLYTPFPVESCLLGRICENLNAEIVSSTCKTLFDIVGYLTWTFFARRVKANPSYYGAISSKQEDVEAFLLSIAKESLTLLEKEGCIILDGDLDEVDCDISPTSLGAASSKFYLSYRTPRQMRFGLLECCKLIKEGEAQGSRKEEELSVAWLLYTIACTHEFDELPVRHNEDELNLELSKKVMWGPDVSKVLNLNDQSRNDDSEIFASPHTKSVHRELVCCTTRKSSISKRKLIYLFIVFQMLLTCSGISRGNTAPHQRLCERY